MSALVAQADAPRAEPQPLELLVGYLPLILIGITSPGSRRTTASSRRRASTARSPTSSATPTA